MSASHRRRSLPTALIALASAALLAGCSSGDPSQGDDGAEESNGAGDTRTVTTELGEVEVPVDPEVIVATDEPAALNMLAIGVVPDVVFDSWKTTVPKQIIEDEGIEVVSTASMYPELEEVAKYEPDLIVSTVSEGWEAAGPDYPSIAPTIGALYSGAGAGEIVDAYGEYFDRAEEAGRVNAALDELTEQVAASQPETPRSLSVVMSWAQDNMPIYMDGDNSLHQTIADAGFTRPKLQDESPEGGSKLGGWTPFSAEELTDQDADVMAIAVAAQYNLEGITELPLYSSLNAVKNDRALQVDGDIWSSGSSFYTYWVLRDLETFTGDAPKAGTADDAKQRWSDFQAAIEG